MPRITPVGVADVETDEDGFIVRTGKVTIKGAEFYITTTPTGLYCIQTPTGGTKPKVCEEKFTSLFHARKALEEYEFDNRSTFAAQATGRKKREEFLKDDEKRNSEALPEL